MAAAARGRGANKKAQPVDAQERFGWTTWDWIQSKLKIGRFKLEVSEEVQVLQKDWIAENSDAREEGVMREEYERRIAAAEEARDKDKLNPVKWMELAEAYGVVEPRDERVLKLLERICKGGDIFFDKMRQGDAYQMLGRSYFLACRFEESLEVMLKAHECYKENGNRTVRRFNNVGLLRVYAALGDSRKASERLQVALTQVEEKDDSMLLYMHAKNALEKTGVARDAEVLDDIWYVHMDINEDDKTNYESHQQMASDVLRSCNPDDETEDKTWAECISIYWPMIKRELMSSQIFVFCCYSFVAVLFIYILLHVVSAIKRSGK